MVTGNFLHFWRDIGFFKISGPDAERYLQGRVSQDIKKLKPHQSKQTFILNPQGRIEGKFAIAKEENSFYIWTDPFTFPGTKAEFHKALLKFKVADQFSVDDLSNLGGCYSLFSNDLEYLERVSSEIENLLKETKIEYVYFKNSRAFLKSVDFIILGESSEIAAIFSDKLKIELLSPEKFNFLRIQSKYPLMEIDINNSILAPDLPLEDYVSNQKGCYAGQEVVEMATARGRANKRLCQFLSTSPIQSLVPIKIFNEPENSEVGFISSYSNYGTECLSLGFLKTKFLENDALFIEEDGKKIYLKTDPC